MAPEPHHAVDRPRPAATVSRPLGLMRAENIIQDFQSDLNFMA
jgi:hypothetical protein